MSKRSPWIYVPTLYFAQGLPFTTVMMMSAVYFKDLGASNVLIGLTSALQLPWILKFAWAPLVDFFSRKKRWIVVAQVVLAVFFAALSATTLSGNPVGAGIAALGFIALASATHDAAIDGYYLEVLTKPEQALFVGVRNTAFRMSMIFGSGAMVYLAGTLTAHMGKQHAWFTAFAILSVVMFVLFSLHCWYLPPFGQVKREEEMQSADAAANPAAKANPATPAESEQTKAADQDSSQSAGQNPPSHDYFRAILSYFDQPGTVAIVAYILLFRLGDAMVMKMIPPFLQDPVTKHGMGLSVEQIGTVYGTVGVCFLLLGGIIGGILVSKQGLKFWFWPATLLMNSTILLYWLLATFHPTSIGWIYLVNSLEQFGYGFGMAAYTVFLLSTVKQEYKAAHYAVASALMALGLMAPSMASGIVCDKVGYAGFFLLSFILTIPGVITIPFLPLWRKEKSSSVF
jgi:MFS transporter, PAT family, beta-lactamase induction signal transducer AmpG